MRFLEDQRERSDAKAESADTATTPPSGDRQVQVGAQQHDLAFDGSKVHGTERGP